jgi:hypothetical protein
MKFKNINKFIVMLLSEFGLDLSFHQHRMIQILILKFDLDVNSCTYSSGRSLIFLKHDKAYQLYLTNELFEKVLQNLDTCHEIEGIVKQYIIHPKFNTVEYERIEPIYNVVTNSIIVNDSFYSDIYTILESFLKYRIVHGDFCCDNIGYSSKQKRYVIYDLETVRPMRYGDEEIDKNRFEKSVKFPIIVSLRIVVVAFPFHWNRA